MSLISVYRGAIAVLSSINNWSGEHNCTDSIGQTGYEIENGRYERLIPYDTAASRWNGEGALMLAAYQLNIEGWEQEYIDARLLFMQESQGQPVWVYSQAYGYLKTKNKLQAILAQLEGIEPNEQGKLF